MKRNHPPRPCRLLAYLGVTLALSPGACSDSVAATESDSEGTQSTSSSDASSTTASSTTSDSTDPSTTAGTSSGTTSGVTTSSSDPTTTSETGQTTTGSTSDTTAVNTDTTAEPCDDGPTDECCAFDPEFEGCPPVGCLAPELYDNCDVYTDLDKNDGLAFFNAIGLGCPGADASTGIQIADYAVKSNNPLAWQILRGFGDYHVNGDPQMPLYFSGQDVPKLDDNNMPIEDEFVMESNSFVVLSTGELPPPDNNGIITDLFDQTGNGDNSNLDSPDALPDPMTHECGSNSGDCNAPFTDCVPNRDCSDSLQIQWELNGNPNDMMWAEFTTQVPQDVTGYGFRFAFFSSEWPIYAGEPFNAFNDLFIGWQVNEAYTGNITYLPDGQGGAEPMTITTLDSYFLTDGFACKPKNNPQCTKPPELAGTGFEAHAATRWLDVRAPVAPESELLVMFFIADISDSILASQVALDSWHWQCQGCVLGQDCGVLLP